MAFFHTNFMLQSHHHPEVTNDDDRHLHHHSLPPILPPPSSNPQDQFHGAASLLAGKRSSMAFATGILEDNTGNNVGGEEELSDEEGSQLGEKKRRLNMEQVRTLEKNFELGNKLEPERKMQLARALGLQPRQIAIWFQNRRARWKTKQLEKDYDLLKRQFEAVKAENDALQAHNQKLHAEIMALKTRELPTESINLNKETEGSCSNRSENTSEIKLDMATNPASIDSPAPAMNNNNNNNNNPTTTTTSRPLFPISSSTRASVPPPQLFLTSSSCPNNHHHINNNNNNINNHKMDPHQNVKEESLCSMFCGMDDQTGFWPWLEQQHFN